MAAGEDGDAPVWLFWLLLLLPLLLPLPALPASHATNQPKDELLSASEQLPPARFWPIFTVSSSFDRCTLASLEISSSSLFLFELNFFERILDLFDNDED